MNRLAPFASTSFPSPKSTRSPKQSEPTINPAQRADFSYFLLGPQQYEPNYAYPLLVWLHGPGDDERQLRHLMPKISLRNYVAVGLRGSLVEPCGYTYTWNTSESAAAAAGVKRCVALARDSFNVNPEGIFLGGLGVGGTMALRIALAEPELFGGAISLGGSFPINCAALHRFQAARDLPLLMLRGMESEAYTIDMVQEELRLFHAARMRVHSRQYSCGDEVIVPMLRDIDSWLMEQVTNTPILDSQDAANTRYTS